ncbi:hypothetical protein LCGC14_0851880 [marine sediment metagenome]|uniref:Uncharacterized protein n=1 Tax=marine sediment metagenome TaxID=412755 RepID=A0A0F9RUQ4_9ZZZZ
MELTNILLLLIFVEGIVALVFKAYQLYHEFFKRLKDSLIRKV